MEVLFSSVIAENFLSIGRQTRWEIGDQGLVLINGENHDSQAADSNGSGKSTLFEALVWTLWGRTVRGQVNDDVVNRSVGKDCCCQVVFVHGDMVYQVARYRKHSRFKNGLTFKGSKESKVNDYTGQVIAQTQAALDEVLGIDFNTFIRGPMLPQGSIKRFSQMTDSEMKAVLDDILQVEVIQTAHARAKDAYSKAESELGIVEHKIETCVEGIAKAELMKQEYLHELATFEQKRQREIQVRTAAVADLDEEIAKTRKKYVSQDDLQAMQAEVAEKANKAEDLYERLVKQWDGRVSDRVEAEKELQSKVAVHESHRDHLLERIKQVEELTGECPTCEQPINEKHKAHALATFNKMLGEVQDSLLAAESDLDIHKADTVDALQDREQALNRCGQAVKKLRKEQYTAEAKTGELAEVDKRIQTLEAQRLTLLEEIEEWEEEKPKCEERIDDLTSEMAQLNKQQTVLVAKREAYSQRLFYYGFWTKGFGNQGLKSFIFRSIIPFMNQRAAYYTKILTDGELSIEFSPTVTLKSGAVRDQFSVNVVNKAGASTYQGNSGGEKSRADLVISFVLSDLVAARARKGYPQRFFDELFEGLDGTGVESVMEVLSDMASQAGSIFVITHQQGMQNLFGSTLKVVKRNGFSNLEGS